MLKISYVLGDLRNRKKPNNNEILLKASNNVLNRIVY